MGWTVYLLRCADGTFYTGITTDLARRVRQHNGESPGGARYTRTRRPALPVWSEGHPDRSSAARREGELRRMGREGKQRLAGG
jgi:putative endonuclease